MSNLSKYGETVNEDILNKLSKLTITQFKEMMSEAGKKYSDKDFQKEYTKLSNYTTYQIGKKNKNVVSYAYADMKECGRLYAQNPSLQSMNKLIRGILSNGLTIDIDMNNCHPLILLNLCKKHNINCFNLSSYILNREKHLTELINEYGITRSEAKDCYLQALNKHDLTTKINGKIVKNKSFIDYDKELTGILDALFEIKEYNDEFYKYVKSASYNQKGKMINLILQKTENEYLQRAIQQALKFGVVISTQYYDGFTVYPEDKDINELIRILDNEFAKEHMKWSIKEHDISLLDILKDIEIIESDNFFGTSIFDIADHCIKGILKDKIYMGNTDKEIYLLTDRIILSDYESISVELLRILYKQDYYRIDYKSKKQEGGLIQVSKEVSEMNNLVSTIMKLCPKNKQFISDIWDYTRFKIFFNNGYYDFKLKQFIKGKFNKTFIKIDHNYSSTKNEKAYDTLFNKILYPVFTINNVKKDKERMQLLQNFLYRMSRIIASHIEDKIYIELEGMRNCGKGVISDLLKTSFTDYIRTSNSSNFVYKKNIQDVAKSQSWIIPFEFVRLCITQEIKTEEVLDGAMVKKFCSGGDYMEARQNYKDEKEFKIQCSLMICCNDSPEMKPKDAKDFCYSYQMKSVFIDDNFKEEDKLNTYSYYKKEDIKELLKDKDLINEFINLILCSYNNKVDYPEETKKENDEIKDDNDYTELFNLFEFTGNTDDKINNDDLQQIIKDSKIPFNLQKCKKLLITKGAKVYRTPTTRYLQFIKIKDNFEDIDNIN